jgi:hypothetical protein
MDVIVVVPSFQYFGGTFATKILKRGKNNEDVHDDDTSNDNVPPKY